MVLPEAAAGRLEDNPVRMDIEEAITFCLCISLVLENADIYLVSEMKPSFVYGVIGQRLADGVALQKDMELVGVADLAPTLSIRALKEKGMPYDLYLVDGADKSKFDTLGIPVSGTFADLDFLQVNHWLEKYCIRIV